MQSPKSNEGNTYPGGSLNHLNSNLKDSGKVRQIYPLSHKPILKLYGRSGNSLAVVGSAKQRLREAQRFDLANQLDADLVGVTDHEAILQVISKYLDIR